MNGELKQILTAIFNQSSLKDVPLQDLRQMVAYYPYSALFQFLYAKKLKEENHTGYADAAVKTSLYFNNPHWLNYLLNSLGAEEKILAREVQDAQVDETVLDELITVEEKIAVQENQEYGAEPVKTDGAVTEKLTNGMDQYVAEDEVAFTQQEVVEQEQIEAIATPETVNDNIETVEMTDTGQADQSNLVQETIVEPVLEQEPEFQPQQQASPPETVVEEASFDKLEPEPIIEVQAVQEEIVQPASEEKKPTEDAFIPFEPLYTIDYFASQGIKLSGEEETKDALSHKLKSFTDWLKSMKRIHEDKFKIQLDDGEEINIQVAADHSNDETVVVTETMAEVLMKQGRFDKALEIYQKLSLLNPSKSAYFAARIQQLKAT